jgi:hypothetical protein
MSYYTELVLLAKVRRDRQRQIKAEIDHPPRYNAGGLATFVALLAMRDGGTLCFKSKGHPFWSDYDVDDEDGLLDALNAPWSDTDEIASWLAQYVTSSSRIIFHSLELDGTDFSYEFDGKEKFRYMEYRPVRGWRKPLALSISPAPLQKHKTQQKKLKDAKSALKMIENEYQHRNP